MKTNDQTDQREAGSCPAPCSAELELADELHAESMRRDEGANLLENASQAIRRLATALVDANDLCRSAYQVAERTGVNTNWNGLEACLSESLARQHAVMYPPNEKAH